MFINFAQKNSMIQIQIWVVGGGNVGLASSIAVSLIFGCSKLEDLLCAMFNVHTFLFFICFILASSCNLVF